MGASKLCVMSAAIVFHAYVSNVLAGRQLFLSNMQQCGGRDDWPVMVDVKFERSANKTMYLLNGNITFRESFPKGFKCKCCVYKIRPIYNNSLCE